MPAGSRHMTSAGRLLDAVRGQVQESKARHSAPSRAAEVAVLEAAVIRAVEMPSWPMATARLKAMVVLPTPPFRREDPR